MANKCMRYAIGASILLLAFCRRAEAAGPVRISWYGGSCVATNIQVARAGGAANGVSKSPLAAVRVTNNFPLFMHWHTIPLRKITEISATGTTGTGGPEYRVTTQDGETYVGWLHFQATDKTLAASSSYLVAACIGGLHRSEDYSELLSVTGSYMGIAGQQAQANPLRAMTPVQEAEVHAARVAAENAREARAAAQLAARAAAAQAAQAQQAQAAAAAARAQANRSRWLKALAAARSGTYVFCYSPQPGSPALDSQSASYDVVSYYCRVAGSNDTEGTFSMDRFLTSGWRLVNVEKTRVPAFGGGSGSKFTVTLEKRG